MTTYNKQSLAAFFQNGDVPTGTDYSNLIDSQINIVETSAQSMAGPLVSTEVITPKVSATTVNVTGTLTATTLSNTNASFSGIVSAVNINITNDVSAATGTVYASAMRSTNGIFFGTGIVSAAGTTQGTATILTNVINRGQGVADGATTGFALLANRTGLVQYLINETAVSANLWPPTGGKINNGTANIPLALVANTSYTIFHYAASAYGVK